VTFVSEHDKRRISPASLRRLFGQYRPEAKLTALTTVLSVASSLAELAPAVLIRNAINYLDMSIKLPGRAEVVIWPFVAAIALMALIHGLLRFVQTLARAELTVRIANGLRERMYRAVQRHSLTYHKKTTTGDLIARSTRDIQSIARFVGFGVFAAADLVIFLGGACAVLLWINPVFALIALCPLPLVLFLVVRSSARVRGLWRETSESYAKVTTVVQENVAGARVVRAFAQEHAERAKFVDRADAYVGKAIASVRFWVVRTLSSNFVFGMIIPLALLYGSYQVMGGRIEIGDIVLCFFYMRPVEHRLRHLMNMAEVYQSGAAGAERVFEVLDEEPSIASNPGARPAPRPAEKAGAAVEFRNVSFGYDPGKPVLRDISFRAGPGETVGIVGHTGSGKSTLISLIPRFHDPTDGTVTLNGVDVRDIRLRELRRSVGMIFQETFLFSASVRENIAYGRPGADFEAIQAAARAARADDFIRELEDGYDAVVGDRGVTLSGGQAQRIAIARAVLLDPQVLVLDDATASVDSETERLIRETVRGVAQGRTSFVVAHRVSSVAHADRILVLDGGRVAEQGTHRELFALGGIYRRMCDQQFTGGHDDG